ncbi:MAG TPA: dienelactone hydrolase family protein [Oculatellaceae cyanobacterium]|jgi:putative phosphoribosyl transferase
MAETVNHSIENISVRIPCGRETLLGDLAVPQGAKGLVLFVHGSGSSRLSPRNRYVADFLNRAGLGTLLFDLLTQEEERIDILTRELRFDIVLLADRLGEATRWVRQQSELKYLKLGYFGASTGAAAALLEASRHATQVDAIVSRGGRPDLVGAALRNVAVPTLLIVGGADYQVIQLNKQALQQLCCEKELLIIPGATHLFEESGALEEVARASASWFIRFFGNAQSEPASR